MSAQPDSFDRRLAAWLDESSAHAVPDHLDAVLVRTIATRQRPAWSSLERWLPMASPIPGSARNRRLVLLLAAAALLVVLAVMALGVGRTGDGNGRILVADGTILKSYAADGSDLRTEMTIPEGAGDISLSPDGRYLAYRTEGSPRRLQFVDLTTKAIATVDAGPTQNIGDAHWAPGSDRFAFVSYDGRIDHIRIGTVDGRPATEVSFDTTGMTSITNVEWSPDGAWLAFTAEIGGAPGGIYLVHPDGSGLRQLVHADLFSESAGDLAWRPGAGGSQLLYVQTDGVHVHDLATDKDTFVGDGFWPAWSPTGDRIAYWHDGVQVVAFADVLKDSVRPVRPAPEFSGSCGDHANLAGTVWCGSVSWSPDGTRLIGMDLGADRLLSLMADGTGKPFSIKLQREVQSGSRYVVWLRP